MCAHLCVCIYVYIYHTYEYNKQEEIYEVNDYSKRCFIILIVNI